MQKVLTDTSIPDPPSAELLAKVGLTRAEYDELVKKLRRLPNLVEMGIAGAMWSEHCCYKSSKRHLKKLPATGKRVVQGPGENAGILDLGGDYAVVFKIESHNHPSAVEPFQGAATGVGGIIRDIFAMGARPIALLDSLRFGNLREIAPAGSEDYGAVDDDDAADEAADRHEGVRIPWTEEPKPLVLHLAWLTHMRMQLLERGPAARKAVELIRSIHDEGEVEVLAFCVMPDNIQLVVWVKDGAEETAALVVNQLKAQLAELGEGRVKPGQPIWETGFRNHRKFDQLELEEVIKRVEYTPVQRGTVSHIKDYPHVSSVWRFGVAWRPVDAVESDKPQEMPYCPGVTGEQAARNRFLLAGVVSGIANYGNCIGIPTVGGEVVFDPSYSSNCLVNAMCVGIVKKDRILKGIAAGAGNTALIVGAKTGRDGVQGATFASVDLPEDYAKERPAVQVGDPFMEKLLLEATLEINGRDGLVGLQDFGAAGLTCSGVEMASRAGTGMKLNLDLVPQRAKDLSAYEMMLSESQERMMVVVEKGHEEEFVKVFNKWGLTAVACGEVLPDKDLVVLFKGKEVARIPNAPLADEAPDYDRETKVPEYYKRFKPLADIDVSQAMDRIDELPVVSTTQGNQLAPPVNKFERVLRQLINSPNIASKRPVWQQYDYMVRTNTVAGPGPSDAAVMRIKETGQGLAIATDGSGRHVYLEPKLGAVRAVLESARNVIATGALPIGVTNCLNFGNPEKPDRMWQFTQTIAGMTEALDELDLPVTGGNVSLYNESGGRPILPTPVIGMVGLLDKFEQAVPNQCEGAGLELYVLGNTDGRLDGSALMFELGRARYGKLAEHDYRTFRECQRFVLEAVRQGALAACHDISDGGLAVAVMELSPAGAELDLSELLPENYDNEYHNLLAALFGEEGHRWLLAIDKQHRGWIRTAAMHYEVPLQKIGMTADGRLTVSTGGSTILDCPSDPLNKCLASGLADALADV